MAVCRVAYILYPVTTLGPGQRIGIWFRGCSRHCDGCISPELQSPEGPKTEISSLICMLRDFMKTHTVDGITISGGEPFEQAVALTELVESMSIDTQDILIYTGYSLSELEQMASYSRIAACASVLITGEYIAAQDDAASPLYGSINQKLVLLKPEFEKIYADYILTHSRQVDSFLVDDKVILVGIP